MKIALPVENEHKKLFGNAGHTPMFAIYTLSGNGMFRSFVFEELRKNPRSDLDHHHHHDDEHHTCDHDDNDQEHIRQHQVMAEALEDCDYLVVKRACKNTAKSMANLGIKLVKYNGQGHVRFEVVKGGVDSASPDARYQVDGLAGATLTSNGVTNLVRYWLGENGFGPFLDKVRAEGAKT